MVADGEKIIVGNLETYLTVERAHLIAQSHCSGHRCPVTVRNRIIGTIFNKLLLNYC